MATSISGLLWAKSPIFTLKKIHAFLLAIKTMDSQEDIFNVAVLVVANSVEFLSSIYSDRFPLNEFIRLNHCKINKISLDGGQKWHLLVMRPEKEGNLCIIKECQLEPFECNFECRLNGLDLDLTSYEGHVTSVEPRILIDESIHIVGLDQLRIGQSVRLLNLFRIPNHPVKAYLYAPFFSSAFFDDIELLHDNPSIKPNFAFEEALGSLKIHLSDIGCQSMLSVVAKKLFISRSIASLFLGILSEPNQSNAFFKDFRLKKVSMLKDLASKPSFPQGSRLSFEIVPSNSILIGKIGRCKVSGLLQLVDDSNSALITCGQEGELMFVDGFELVTEAFLVDPMIMSVALRTYIVPTSFKCFQTTEFSNGLVFKPDRHYMLANITNVSPPSLLRLKPVTLEGNVKGKALCLFNIQSEKLHLKSLEKIVDIPLSSECWAKYCSALTMGAWFIASRDKNNTFQFEIPVDLELDRGFKKGEAFLEGQLLRLSREVLDYVGKKSVPFSISQDIRFLADAGCNEAVSFKGLVKDIKLFNLEHNIPDLTAARLYSNYSIGLPVNGACLQLLIEDIAEPSIQIAVDYTPTVLPLRLRPGAVIEGRYFRAVNGRLVSQSNSSILILPSDRVPETNTSNSKNPTIPFHYLADFYGYHTAQPNALIMVQVFPLKLISVKIWACCKRCSSKIEQLCCPIHDKIQMSETVVNAHMICTATDSTLNAEMIFESLDVILAFLRLEKSSEFLKQSCAVSGFLDHSLPLFASCFVDELKVSRYRVKGICIEAPSKVNRRPIGKRESYSGKVLIRVLEATLLDDRDVAYKYLELLEI